jgi:hypothetical protein
VSGAVLLVHLAAVRFLLTADAARVYFLGRPLDWACSFHARFGLPCPTCGMTRSVVMMLHGHPADAWRLAPGGPVAVFLAFGFGVSLIALAVLRWLANPAADQVVVNLRRWSPRFAAAGVALWTTGWAVQFAAAWTGR